MKSNLNAIVAAAAIALSLSFAGAARAQQAAATAAQPAPASSSAFTPAEVRKVDKGAKKITLKHDEIKNLDMPPMTMVFAVKDETVLDKVKAGDKVRFRATNESGKLTVIDLEAAK